MFTQLAVKRSIDDLVAARNKTVTRYEEIHRLIALANSEISQFSGSVFQLSISRHETLKEHINKLDRSLWIHLFDDTGLSAVMDKQARDQFEDAVYSSNCPPFTIETIEATIKKFVSDADTVFKRGIVNVFRGLSGNYKTHDAFKIGSKMIINGVFRHGYAWNHRQTINDIDRVVSVLLGQEFKDGDLFSKVNETNHTSGRKSECDKYVIKVYANGNVHLTIKSGDVIDQINGIIAEWFGEGKLGKK